MPGGEPGEFLQVVCSSPGGQVAGVREGLVADGRGLLRVAFGHQKARQFRTGNCTRAGVCVVVAFDGDLEAPAGLSCVLVLQQDQIVKLQKG
ncbi:hypothetical protein [Streptomyces toyocaensis]|uniref:hypothetical protein n=1 Tax=Streptomyces toyocaensis TaxID=55952 RepID=UPI003F4CDF06